MAACAFPWRTLGLLRWGCEALVRWADVGPDSKRSSEQTGACRLCIANRSAPASWYVCLQSVEVKIGLFYDYGEAAPCSCPRRARLVSVTCCHHAQLSLMPFYSLCKDNLESRSNIRRAYLNHARPFVLIYAIRCNVGRSSWFSHQLAPKPVTGWTFDDWTKHRIFW